MDVVTFESVQCRVEGHAAHRNVAKLSNQSITPTKEVIRVKVSGKPAGTAVCVLVSDAFLRNCVASSAAYLALHAYASICSGLFYAHRCVACVISANHVLHSCAPL